MKAILSSLPLATPGEAASDLAQSAPASADVVEAFDAVLAVALTPPSQAPAAAPSGAEDMCSIVARWRIATPKDLTGEATMVPNAPIAAQTPLTDAPVLDDADHAEDAPNAKTEELDPQAAAAIAIMVAPQLTPPPATLDNAPVETTHEGAHSQPPSANRDDLSPVVDLSAAPPPQPPAIQMETPREDDAHQLLQDGETNAAPAQTLFPAELAPQTVPLLAQPEAAEAAPAPSPAAGDRRQQAAEIRVKALERQIVAAIRQGSETLRMQLYPPGLGQVVLRLTMDGKSLRVSARTGSEDATQALRAVESALRETLADNGVHLQSFDLAQDESRHGGARNRRTRADRKAAPTRGARFSIDMNA